MLKVINVKKGLRIILVKKSYNHEFTDKINDKKYRAETRPNNISYPK